MEILLRKFKVLRSYPQPDSPVLSHSHRNRALAVFKYLLGLEPEEAEKHDLYKCIEHAFEQQAASAQGRILNPSLVTILDDTKALGAEETRPMRPITPTEQDMRELLKQGEPLFNGPSPAKMSQRHTK